MEIAVGVIIIGAAVFFYRLSKQRDEDAEAFFWATRREPLVFISEHPFDRTVEARQKEAVAKLEKHGNKFLKPWDVWMFVYRVHVPLYSNVTAIEINHSVWYDTVLREVAAKKADWLAMKATFIKDGAGQMFANQQTGT